LIASRTFISLIPYGRILLRTSGSAVGMCT
jgi:hypothetical protein